MKTKYLIEIKDEDDTLLPNSVCCPEWNNPADTLRAYERIKNSRIYEGCEIGISKPMIERKDLTIEELEKEVKEYGFNT